jgi:hypothetical protein
VDANNLLEDFASAVPEGENKGNDTSMIMADDSLFCTVSTPSLQSVQLFPLSNKSHSNISNIKFLSSIFCKVFLIFYPHQGGVHKISK